MNIEELRQVIDHELKTQQEYVQECTLANIQAAKTSGQWIIHDPNRENAVETILDIVSHYIAVEKTRARIEEVNDELERYGDVFNYPPQLLVRKSELVEQLKGLETVVL